MKISELKNKKCYALLLKVNFRMTILKSLIIKTILILFTIHGLNLQAADILTDSAIAAYTTGDYENALELFLSIQDKGYTSAPLYYNIGCSYYKSGNIPHAILYYEKALLINPGDEDIIFSLKIANTMIADKIVQLPEFFLKRWFKALRNKASGDNWAIMAIVGFAIMSLSIFIFLLTSGYFRKISFLMIPISLVFVIFAFCSSYSLHNEIKNRSYGILMSPVAIGKSSPTDNSVDLFVIHEGIKLKILEKVTDWSHVQLPDGKKGWLRTEQYELI
jgi:tetratricopeptide (TPR) repeat protein